MASGQPEGEKRKRKPSAISVSPMKKNSPPERRVVRRKKPDSKEEKIMAEQSKSGEGEAIPSQAEDKVQSSASHARRAADDLRSAAGAVAEEYRGRAEEVWNEASDRVRSFQEDTEQYVRDNPTKAIFTALGVGFVLGLIFRR
jgi:ElaB/YqjD/DUF883 family membrane-anchored ribosome-binding protein